MQDKIFELDNIEIKLELGNVLLNILYVRFSPPSRIKHIGNHCHSSYELHYIPYGKGRLTAGGRSFQISPMTLYLTGPDVYHEQIGDPADPMAEYCINFEIIKKQVKPDKKTGNPDKDSKSIEKLLSGTSFWFGNDEYNCINLFEKIMEEINRKHIGYYLNIRNYLSIILLNTIRCYSSDQLSPNAPPVKAVTDKWRLICDQYVQNNWNTRTINELASHLGVSIRHLNRIFVKYYGMSFHKKLTLVRMENAANQLAETSMSVREIAELVGYDDHCYFCRIFKKHFHMTALEYRKKAKTTEKDALKAAPFFLYNSG